MTRRRKRRGGGLGEDGQREAKGLAMQGIGGEEGAGKEGERKREKRGGRGGGGDSG